MNDNESTPSFGSREWLADALIRKYEGIPERPAEELTSVTDYLYLKQLEEKLWIKEELIQEFIWQDPWDFDQPDAPAGDPLGDSQ